MPPLLLGIPGDSTYANYAEATGEVWRQTVIPLARATGGEFVGLAAGWRRRGIRAAL